MDKTEYLAEYCASIDCKSTKLGDCDLCMYKKGRADKYQEIVSEYMLLTEKQVADIRTDAFDELSKEIEYCLNCGMGKDKSLEHLLKICRKVKEQNNGI